MIPLAITNVLEGKKVPVYGDGRNVRDWLYDEDHCRAIDAVLTNGRIGETYCVGGHAESDNLGLAKLLVELMGMSEDMITFVPDRPGHDLRYGMDTTKIERELGWQPTVPLREGLQCTIQWFTDHRAWYER